MTSQCHVYVVGYDKKTPEITETVTRAHSPQPGKLCRTSEIHNLTFQVIRLTNRQMDALI